MKRSKTGEKEVLSTNTPNTLVTLRQSTETYISATDGKAMTLLGVGGATLAFAGVQTTQRTASFLPMFSGVFFALFCCLGVMSCIASVCCLWPRTERKRLLREKNFQPLSKSPTVFWELADLDSESFAAHTANITEETFRRDMLEQAMFATWVAKQKLYYLKIAIVLFMGALLALFTSLLLSIL
jgi:hypothetical protein